MLILGLRALALWLSLFGYCLFIKKEGIDSAFAPAITVSVIGVSLFFAGILNILPYAVILLLLGGYVCAVIANPFKDKTLFGKRDFVSFGIFSVLSFLFAIRVYGTTLTNYDAFSHWLTVVKELLITNQLPNFESGQIMFQSYPTGTAGFIYFICKILGRSGDGMVLFAQSILVAACITVFAAFVKKVNFFTVISAAAAMLYCIVANSFSDTPIAEMLVDTLVSLVAVAALAVIIYYKDNLIFAALASLPMQIFLVAVKNSGIIMLAFNVFLLVFLSVMQDKKEKSKFSFIRFVKLGLISGAIPAASLFIWNRHVAYVFTSGNSSKHSMSLENYANVLGEKNMAEIKEILLIYLKRFFSFNNSVVLLLIIGAVLLGGWLLRRYIINESGKTELLVFLGTLFSYLGFMAILAGMYLVSMPYNESVVLASYDRYEKTVVIYMIAAIVIYLLWLGSRFKDKEGDRFVYVTTAIAICAILLTESANIPKLFIKTDHYQGSQREHIENVKAEYNLPEGESYFLYGSSVTGDGDYTYYLGKYIFWSPQVNAGGPDTINDKKAYMQDYHYLIVLERDEHIDALLKERGFTPGQKVYHWSGN